MADNSILIHNTFVSPKANSSDSTLVSSNAWNAALMLSGGSDGQMALRDSTQLQGAKWGQAQSAQRVIDSYTGTSPSSPLAATTVTLTQNALLLVATNHSAVISSGNSFTQVLNRNGAAARTRTIRGTGDNYCSAFDLFTETPGTISFNLVYTTNTGITFTTLAVELIVVVLARL